MLKKIYKEIKAIRNELHNIKNAMESQKTDAEKVADEIADKLRSSLSSISL